jgi:hypothetical protein
VILYFLCLVKVELFRDQNVADLLLGLGDPQSNPDQYNCRWLKIIDSGRDCLQRATTHTLLRTNQHCAGTSNRAEIVVGLIAEVALGDSPFQVSHSIKEGVGLRS